MARMTDTNMDFVAKVAPVRPSTRRAAAQN